MPTNVTADYKRAEQAFRRAAEPRERLDCLKEMLRTLPKHKGTEHLQADIKSRIKHLNDEIAGPKKGGARSGPALTVRPEGAAQVALLGAPNSGKSALHARLTGSHAAVGSYPFTTHYPQPGMMPFEDIYFQLIDLPPVTGDYMEPWLPNALFSADAALLVVDIRDPECPDQIESVMARLSDRHITLSDQWPDQSATASDRDTQAADGDDETANDVFHSALPTALIANKIDLGGTTDDVQALQDLLGVRFPTVCVSAETGTGLETIARLLFDKLEIVRVYTKAPGGKTDQTKPFSVRKGDTVLAVARLVHREMAEKLKFARAWGNAVYDGQQVGPEYEVSDGDTLEIHTN